MQKQTALFEVVKEPVSLDWRAGVIMPLDNVVEGVCVLCGYKKSLNHERFSGGLPSKICQDCAEKYVERAQKVLEKYEGV